MAKAAIGSILKGIRKFGLVLTRRAVNMLVCSQIRESTANMPNMVMSPGEQHGVGGGLQSLSAFFSFHCFCLNIFMVH